MNIGQDSQATGSGEGFPRHCAALRDSAKILDYVVIAWRSTRSPEGVIISTKSLRSMVPARGFEPLAP